METPGDSWGKIGLLLSTGSISSFKDKTDNNTRGSRSTRHCRHFGPKSAHLGSAHCVTCNTDATLECRLAFSSHGVLVLSGRAERQYLSEQSQKTKTLRVCRLIPRRHTSINFNALCDRPSHAAMLLTSCKDDSTAPPCGWEECVSACFHSFALYDTQPTWSGAVVATDHRKKIKKKRTFLVCEITLYVEDGDKFCDLYIFFKALLDVHFTAELYQGIIPQDRWFPDQWTFSSKGFTAHKVNSDAAQPGLDIFFRSQ